MLLMYLTLKSQKETPTSDAPPVKSDRRVWYKFVLQLLCLENFLYEHTQLLN
jgi:hypothetical protein